MDYEKLYKEALNKAKSKIWNDKGHVLYEDDIVEIFPELAESEDDRIKKALIKCMERFPYDRLEINGVSIEDAIAWLEKQGKNKPSWGEEDEKIIETMCKEGDLKPSEMRWLKSLKDRVQPKPKQEWSENDEYQINTILHELDLKREIYKKEGNKVEEDRYNTQYNWLKSFKSNHWKPSEYDISLLEEIARNIRNNIRPFCSEVSSLEALIDNLKNL